MARAVAQSHLVEDAFCRATQGQQLERLSREAAVQDATEDRAFAARTRVRELQAE